MESVKPFMWILAISAVVIWWQNHESYYDQCMKTETSMHAISPADADNMCHREANER